MFEEQFFQFSLMTLSIYGIQHVKTVNIKQKIQQIKDKEQKLDKKEQKYLRMG